MKPDQVKDDVANYWNEWDPKRTYIYLYKTTGNVDFLKTLREPIRTFEEFYGQRMYDLPIISILDRLVVLYNQLVTHESLPIEKLEKVIKITQNQISAFALK